MNFSGNDTKFQIGLEGTWGTSVTTTLAIPFLSESLHEVQTPVESEALVGAVTVPYYSIVGRKVEGDVETQMHPDNIGLLMNATLGSEGDATTVITGVFTHDFTPVSGGNSLPHITVVVDKKADEFKYTSLKVNSMSIETSPESLVIATYNLIGQKETDDGATQSLSISTLAPYDFNDMKIYTGTAGATAATNLTAATSLSFNYSNNLENDLFVADGTEYMAEIDYQKRDITFDIECLYNVLTDGLRETNFKTGTALSIRIEFVHPTVIATGHYYTITIDMPHCIITAAPNDISGPERLRIPLSFRALQVGSTAPITFTLKDAKATKYGA